MCQLINELVFYKHLSNGPNQSFDRKIVRDYVRDTVFGAGPDELMTAQTLSHDPKVWQVYSRKGKSVSKDT